MSLDTIKSAVLDEARARAGAMLAEAGAEADRILAEGGAADERAGAEAIRDARLRLDRETLRELERIQYENRLRILSAKNKAIDEVFKRVADRIASLPDDEYLDLVGSWLKALPADVGGELRVSPGDGQKFAARLDALNASRQGSGVFTGVATDPKVSGGAVVNGPDYVVDCTIRRRLSELRETSAGDLARILFGA